MKSYSESRTLPTYEFRRENKQCEETQNKYSCQPMHGCKFGSFYSQVCKTTSELVHALNKFVG